MTERLLLVSDTHGDLRSILSYIRRTPGIDRILHLGDHAWDAEEMQQMLGRVVLGVRGNNDWGSPAPWEYPLFVEGFSLLLTHGHRYGVHFDRLPLVQHAREQLADIVLYGHTHRFAVEQIQSIWAINPGSPSRPYDGVPGCAILTLTKGEEPHVEHVTLDAE